MPTGPSPSDRSTWPIRITRLATPASDDLSSSTTAAERLAMVATLTDEVWALTGRPVPTYSRPDTPIRIKALGGPGATTG